MFIRVLMLVGVVVSASATSALTQPAVSGQGLTSDGRFVVTGKLVNEDGRPLAEWTVEALEVGEKGGFLFSNSSGYRRVQHQFP